MTLSKTLREAVCTKLNGIKPRQLLNRVNTKAVAEGVVDRDIALLLVAHDDAGLDVSKPRFEVPDDKLSEFQEHLKTRRTVSRVSTTTVQSKKSLSGKKGEPRPQKLLSFVYPQVFYKRLEDEINGAFSDPRLPNAVLVLSRKLIENLVYNILQYKLGPSKLEEYYDKQHRRPLDFGVLVGKLEEHKSEFDLDQQGAMGKFLEMVKPFKFEANAKTHNVMDYLKRMGELKKFEIPEMTQILVDIAARVKK